MLAKATLLVHLDPLAKLDIECDASDFAVGGVLQQCVDNIWQSLSFFSKKLSLAETRYSAWIIFGNRCHFSVKSFPPQRHVTVLLTVNFWQFTPRSDTLDIT